MSKDFEQAYKELSQIEVPDLWDRIEAGLTEKSTSKAPEVSKASKEKNKNKTVYYYVKRYSAVAAALLCVVIAVPVLFFMKGTGSKNFESTAEGLQAADTEMADTATAYDTAGTKGAEEAEAPAEEMAGREETAAVTAGEAEGGAWEEATEEASDEAWEEERENAANDSMLSKQSAMDGSAPSEKKLNGEETVIENIVVEVTEVKDNISEGESLRGTGAFYTAVVREDSSGLLTEGEQIVIFIPSDSSLLLLKDEVYKLDIAYDEKGNDYYTVKHIFEQTEE